MDPLAGSTWSEPSMVAGFARSPPNATLLAYARHEQHRVSDLHVVDIGCGAGRNAVPMAALGCTVLGLDLSWPMLAAARERVDAKRSGRLHVALAPMHALPVRSRAADLIVAHGIWNLARSGDEFDAAVREAARIARHGAGLFVFTFSRHTLPPGVEPVPGERIVFTQFSGTPQCFLTPEELVSTLRGAGFTPDPQVPLRELNRRKPGDLMESNAPVILEAAFRFTG